MYMPSKILFLITIFFFSVAASAETSVLNDAYIHKQVSAFEQAYSNRKTAFFAETFTDAATFTIHSKQRNDKSAVQYGKQQLLDGELFQHPNVLMHLERKEENIEYYNDNTQALLTYKMSPRQGSDYRKEKGFLVDVQILFQVVKGEPKIVSIIAHIDHEPGYQKKAVNKQS